MNYGIEKRAIPTKLNALVYYGANVLHISYEQLAKRHGVTVDDIDYHVKEYNKATEVLDTDIPVRFSKTAIMFLIPKLLRSTEALISGSKRAKKINSDAVFKCWEILGVYKSGNNVIVNIGNDAVTISSDQRFADMLREATEVKAEIITQQTEPKDEAINPTIDACLPAIPERPTDDTIIEQQPAPDEPDTPAPGDVTPTSTDDSVV